MLQSAYPKSDLYNDITQIIKGMPAMPTQSLPQIWQDLVKSSSGTGLEPAQRHDYIEAAQLFRFHNTPLCMEALSAIGMDFRLEAYPDFATLEASSSDAFTQKIVAVTKDLFNEFGFAVPASFYNVILESGSTSQLLKMFKNKANLMQDRLFDAVLHASLLVTPIGLFVQSKMSQHGLRFMHVMNCGCDINLCTDEPFVIRLDCELKPAYLQNMLAAAFEQYGVNAATSRTKRGF